MSAPNTPTRHDEYRNEESDTPHLLLTPQPSLKRKATDDITPPAPRKQVREYSTLAMDNGMQLVRQTVGGMQIPLEQALKPITEDEEDDFVDASEELDSEAQRPKPKVPNGLEDDDDDDDDDLFSKINPKLSAAVDNDEDMSDQEADDREEADSTQRVVDCECAEGEHTKQCRNTRNVSTPPGTPSQTIKKERSPSSDALQNNGSKVKVPTPSKLPVEADPDKDLSKTVANFRRWHDRMKHLKPRMNLAEHRYWIGVLPVGRKPKNATSEKHMTWMKGNRVTTISTVWHKMAELSMNEDFVLMLGTEELRFTDTAQQLNRFSDQFICLRAIAKEDPQTRGKPITDGLVPEVVEIDDDWI